MRNWLGLLALALCLHSATAEDRCVVICGDRKDFNGGLKPAAELCDHNNVKYGHFVCDHFDSWKDADDYLQIVGKHDSKNAKLLVIQAAHGGKGGSAECNAGSVSPKEIQDRLAGFQKRYRVGALLNSCYSWDVIGRKLKADAQTDGTGLDRLCIAAASGPGRDAYTAALANAHPSGNLEAFALQNDWHTTSEAWDGAGITEYLVKQDNASGAQALTGLTQMIGQGKVCPQIQQQAQLCMSPKLTSEWIDLLLGYAEQSSRDREPLSWKKSYWIAPTAQNPRPTLPQETDPTLKLVQDCIRSFYAAFDRRVGKGNIQTYSNTQIYTLLEDTASDLKATPEYAACEKAEALRAKNPDAQDMVPSAAEQEMPHLLSWWLDMAVLDPELATDLQKFLRFKKKFKEMIANHDVDCFDVQEFTKELAGDQNTGACTPAQDPETARKVMAAILAENSVGYNLESEASPEFHYRADKPFSPLDLLVGFRNASFVEPEFKSVRDQKRREACRLFEL